MYLHPGLSLVHHKCEVEHTCNVGSQSYKTFDNAQNKSSCHINPVNSFSIHKAF